MSLQERLLEARAARVHAALRLEAHGQLARHALELLVGQQALDEQRARLFGRQVVVLVELERRRRRGRAPRP